MSHLCPREAYGANTNAAWQTGRYSCKPPVTLAGDVELNPGPDTTSLPVVPPCTLTVYYVNVRSLRKRLKDLHERSPDLERYDIIAFTEARLVDKVADSELEVGFPQHTWFRRDRGSRPGGGVACAIRSSLRPHRLPDPNKTETLLIRLQSVSVTVAVCYIPPKSSPVKNVQETIEALDAIQRDCRLIAVGDYNMPQISWTAPADVAGPAVPAVPELKTGAGRDKSFLGACVSQGLKQWVSEPTRNDNTLDLVLTRHLTVTGVVVQDNRFVEKDHKEIIATITTVIVAEEATAGSDSATELEYSFLEEESGISLDDQLLPWYKKVINKTKAKTGRSTWTAAQTAVVHMMDSYGVEAKIGAVKKWLNGNQRYAKPLLKTKNVLAILRKLNSLKKDHQ